MGNYTDLPPHERPGYVPPGEQQPHQQYQNAQPNQYTYTMTPNPVGQAAPQSVTRNVSYSQSSTTGEVQYSQSGIKYTAQPVVQPQPQPQVRHSITSPSDQYSSQLPYPGGSQSHYYPPHPAGPPPPAEESSRKPRDKRDKHDRHDKYDKPDKYDTYDRYDKRDKHGSLSGPPRDVYHPAPVGGPPQQYGNANVVEIVPGGGAPMMPPPPPSGPRPHSLSVSGGHPDMRAPSPGLGPRMDRLSVSGGRPDMHGLHGGGGGGGGGGMPPPSPLLEAYHGTWQSMSPMPVAMRLDDDDLDDLAPLEPRMSNTSLQGGRHRSGSKSHKRDDSPPSKHSKSKDKKREKEKDGHREKDKDKEKRARFYDATDDAKAMIDALAARTIDTEVITGILTDLSHDQIMDLRVEYKRYCKVQGRGINIAKHIKLKTSGNYGKICYVTALGRWESESYWANTWYQSSNARRELLIEALMGRSNNEIAEIKAAFKDKRYNDDLQKCMEKELKADKFRKAVLLALEERKQEEREQWPIEYRNRDVDTLYKALKSREGGESAMLEIVILRSDAHLREVLKTYERKYEGNFARDCLKKSNNLVVCFKKISRF
jgi:hypothetical protein